MIGLRQRSHGPNAYDGDTTVATVTAAAGLDALQRTLAGNGRLIPSGSCSTVRIAGLTLGGGLRHRRAECGPDM